MARPWRKSAQWDDLVTPPASAAMFRSSETSVLERKTVLQAQHQGIMWEGKDIPGTMDKV